MSRINESHVCTWERNKEGRTPKLPTENHMITQRKVTSTDPARRSQHPPDSALRSVERGASCLVRRSPHVTARTHKHVQVPCTNAELPKTAFPSRAVYNAPLDGGYLLLDVRG